MTKLTQWEWEQAVAREATEKQLPQAAQWKRHQHHPAVTISPRSVPALVPSSIPVTPAPSALLYRAYGGLHRLLARRARVTKSGRYQRVRAFNVSTSRASSRRIYEVRLRNSRLWVDPADRDNPIRSPPWSRGPFWARACDLGRRLHGRHAYRGIGVEHLFS